MQPAHAPRSYASLIKSQTSLQTRGRSPVRSHLLSPRVNSPTSSRYFSNGTTAMSSMYSFDHQSNINASPNRRARNLSPGEIFDNTERTDRLLLILGESSTSMKSRPIFFPSDQTVHPQILDKTISSDIGTITGKKVWTSKDDQKLILSSAKNGKNWSEIGRELNRTAVSCRQRLQLLKGDTCTEEPLIAKKKLWTSDEDRNLVISSIKNGNNWIEIGRELNRTPASCHRRSQLLKKKFNSAPHKEILRNTNTAEKIALKPLITKKREFPADVVEIARSVPKIIRNDDDVVADVKSNITEEAVLHSPIEFSYLASFRKAFEGKDSLERADRSNFENILSNNINSNCTEANDANIKVTDSTNLSNPDSSFPWLLPNDAPRDIGSYNSPSNELPIGQHFTEQAATKFLQNIGATSYVNKEFLQGASMAFKSFTEAITCVSQNHKSQIHVQLLHSMLTPALYLHIASAVDKLHKYDEQILLQMCEEDVTSMLRGVTIVWGPDVPNAFSQYELLDQSSDLRIYSYGPDNFLFKWFSAAFVVPKSRFVTSVSGLADSFLSSNSTSMENTPGTFELAMEAMTHGAKVLLDVELTALVDFQHIRKTVQQESPKNPEVILRTNQKFISEGGGFRALMDIMRGTMPLKQEQVETSTIQNQKIKEEIVIPISGKSQLKKTLLQFETPHMKHSELYQREFVHASIFTRWFGKRDKIEVESIESELGSLRISDIDNLVESEAYSRYVIREKLAEEAGFEEEASEHDSYNAHASLPNLDPNTYPKIE
ncbi:hypothetical protein HK096_007061 [Nowakowskiella sp. JEL0078]|nr:hypothetical protein HK096_007061 [Nowakowskiella sp. JEL0078]